jgi:membrane-bound lytic murein transglycosylase D
MRRVLIGSVVVLLARGAYAADAGAPVPAPTPTHTAAQPPPVPAPSAKPSAPAATASTPPKPPTAPPPKPPVVVPPKPPVAGAPKPPVKPVGPARPPTLPDPQLRQRVAGGPTADDATAGAESPELKALRDAERELFPPAGTGSGSPWPNELPFPVARTADAPRPYAGGLAPAPASPQLVEGGKDVGWLSQLVMPDLPVRFDPRVVRFLEFYKDDPRGKALLAFFARRAGRYRDLVSQVLRRKGLPQDLLWLAMVESAFDPAIRSPAGALGLWQFMPETGRGYGLPQDRWVDERMDVDAATNAATDFLSDLYRRFGSWDLAMASYNMGYGGVLSLVRRYNTNDFWALSKMEGSLPWETTLYVPKILALAVAMKNPKVFGIDAVVPDAAVTYELAAVPFATPLATIAPVIGVTTKELEALNPELRAGRTPPKESDAARSTTSPTGDKLCQLRVPPGKAAVVAQNLGKLKKDDAALEPYVLRFGETLDHVAQARGTTAAKLTELNGITPGEALRAGAVLLVPRSASGSGAAPPVERPTVVVPDTLFVYLDRKRVFYKVLVGDTLDGIAAALRVTVDDLRRWNEIDPAARLQDGMTIQAFVPNDVDLSKVVLLAENDVRVLTAGTDEYFAWTEGAKGKKRMVVAARSGETVEAVGKRFGVTAALMEKINRRPRTDKLEDGEKLVVWVNGTAGTTASPTGATAGTAEPEPLGALPPAPLPDQLPKID